MLDQEPKVQWHACDECDPQTNGYKLTVSPLHVPLFGLFLPPSTVVEPLFFGCGNWSIFEGDTHNRMKPSHWAAIVDEEPVWHPVQVRLGQNLRSSAGRAWACGLGPRSRVRLALFDGSQWWEHAGCKGIEPPDWVGKSLG